MKLEVAIHLIKGFRKRHGHYGDFEFSKRRKKWIMRIDTSGDLSDVTDTMGHELFHLFIAMIDALDEDTETRIFLKHEEPSAEAGAIHFRRLARRAIRESKKNEESRKKAISKGLKKHHRGNRS